MAHLCLIQPRKLSNFQISHAQNVVGTLGILQNVKIKAVLTNISLCARDVDIGRKNISHTKPFRPLKLIQMKCNQLNRVTNVRYVALMERKITTGLLTRCSARNLSVGLGPSFANLATLDGTKLSHQTLIRNSPCTI